MGRLSQSITAKIQTRSRLGIVSSGVFFIQSGECLTWHKKSHRKELLIAAQASQTPFPNNSILWQNSEQILRVLKLPEEHLGGLVQRIYYFNVPKAAIFLARKCAEIFIITNIFSGTDKGAQYQRAPPLPFAKPEWFSFIRPYNSFMAEFAAGEKNSGSLIKARVSIKGCECGVKRKQAPR